mgnify:CR=1 FL=1
MIGIICNVLILTVSAYLLGGKIQSNFPRKFDEDLYLWIYVLVGIIVMRLLVCFF